MSADKKRWVVIHFPEGPFKGSINLAIKGEYVVSAKAAKTIIDELDKPGENDDNT